MLMLVTDDVNLLVEFVVMFVSLCSTNNNNYYTNIASIYVQLVDAVDCLLYG